MGKFRKDIVRKEKKDRPLPAGATLSAVEYGSPHEAEKALDAYRLDVKRSTRKQERQETDQVMNTLLDRHFRLHFRDDGQDILWWEINMEGVVVNCNLQQAIWVGTRVVDGPSNPMDIIEGEIIMCLFRSGKKLVFNHPVEKVERLS